MGGVPISVERQAQKLADLGHEVTIFAPKYPLESGEMQALEYEGKVRVIRFRTGKRTLKDGICCPKVILKEITDVFRKETFDLIHTHHPMFVGLTSLYLGRKYQIPVVYTYHTRYEEYLHYLYKKDKENTYLGEKIRKLGKEVIVPWYMKTFTNHCDLILAPTAGMMRWIQANGTNTPIEVFPTGLEESYYWATPLESMKIRSQYQCKYLFCTVGRLEKEKNLEFLLSGIQKLDEKLQDSFQVLVIGTGNQKKILEQQAKKLGIEQKIIFLGNIPNERVSYYLQACDLFLFTSKSETQGIVLAEALASSCPVVAVDASGVEDAIENGWNGYRTVEDADIWSDRVIDVIGSLDVMKKQARESAKGYHATRLAEYEEQLYRKACLSHNSSVCYTWNKVHEMKKI